MKAKPISVSMSEELEAAVGQRMKAERMSSRSEYFRKCIREEIQRAKDHASQFAQSQLQAA